MAAADDIARRLAILAWLRERRADDVASLAEVLVVDDDTVDADLRFLADHLEDHSATGLALDYDEDDGFVAINGRQTGRISWVDILPPGRLSSRELLRVLTAGASLANALPADEAAVLRSALEKVADAHSASAAGLLAHPAHDPGIRAALHDAIERDRQVRIDYQGRADEVARERIVDPHSIAVRGPHAYVWGYAHDREAERAFRLDRIDSCVVLDDPRRTSPPDEPRDAPRYQPGEDDTTITLLLDRDAWWLLDVLDAEGPAEQPGDGRLEVTFRTDVPEWYEEAVLATGGAAVLVEPREVAERIAQRARAGLEVHNP